MVGGELYHAQRRRFCVRMANVYAMDTFAIDSTIVEIDRMKVSAVSIFPIFHDQNYGNWEKASLERLYRVCWRTRL